MVCTASGCGPWITRAGEEVSSVKIEIRKVEPVKTTTIAPDHDS